MKLRNFAQYVATLSTEVGPLPDPAFPMIETKAPLIANIAFNKSNGGKIEIEKFLLEVAEVYREWVITDCDENFNITKLRDKYPTVRIGVRRALLVVKRRGLI